MVRLLQTHPYAMFALTAAVSYWIGQDASFRRPVLHESATLNRVHVRFSVPCSPRGAGPPTAPHPQVVPHPF